jgi:hypothetical protein
MQFLTGLVSPNACSFWGLIKKKLIYPFKKEKNMEEATQFTMMRRLLFITIFLVFCIISCGCMQQPASPPIEGKQTITPTAAPVSPVPVTLSTGSSIAELTNVRPNATLTLDPGVYILSFHTAGPQKLQFLIDGFEDDEEYEVLTTGPYTGALTFGPYKTGEYTLHIAGNGTWNAQLTRADMGTPMKVPVNLSGSGTQVTPFFYLEKGLYIFERNVTSIPTTEFLLRYSNGSFVMDPTNSYVLPGLGVGSPKTWTFLNITEPGIYYMNTQTDTNPSNWTASIIPSPTLPPLGPGPARLPT